VGSYPLADTCWYGKSVMVPTAPKIMIIRHAEKPTRQFAGVDVSGVSSGHDLTVRGWQRAGALACWFAPAHGPLQDPLLARPAFIFASAAATDLVPADSKSRRSEETVTPLAQRIAVDINLTFSKGHEKELAKAVQACEGPVLIAWQHESINLIANSILGSKIAPQTWPDERFDVVFVLTLHPLEAAYSFAQVPQRLLAGDSASPI
jgi:hypothetical protein